jgi:ribonucleoside-diphosphate reductase alpha chain
MTHAPFGHEFPHTIFKAKYAYTPDEDWSGCAARVTTNVLDGLHDAPRGHRVLSGSGAKGRLFDLVDDRRFIPGGRYLYGSGRSFHQVNNCLLLRAEDTREGWSSLKYKTFMALMTGAGIGVYYGDIREKNARVNRTGGKASGPLPLMVAVDQDGKAAVQGGDRRCAIWSGLPWWHKDVFEFISVKNWPKWMRKAIEKRDKGDPDYKDFHAPLEMTNISVCLDDEFFAAYADEFHPKHAHAHDVYWQTVRGMVTTGEPGFSVDCGAKSDEVLRNACTEITSAHDSDVCNLGSLVLPRYDSISQFENAVRDAALFLTAGSLYSDVSYDRVDEVRQLNRRLGLGLIGIHELCLRAGVAYGSEDSFEVLEPWLKVYDRALEFAWDWQDKLGISRSIAATAIAPNGTIGILAESTPSGDPMYSAARWRIVITSSPDGDTRTKHVVIDPVAYRLLKQGIDPSSIEDAYDLSATPRGIERRLAMQAYLQSHVDQAVSSTVNISHQMFDKGEQHDFGETLIRYLPKLRGVTAYPDGARAGQPLQPVDLEWATQHEGETFFESVEETCSGGVCGV